MRSCQLNNIIWSIFVIINSLTPGRYGFSFKLVIQILFYWSLSSDILMIIHSDECHRTGDKSTLVQVMAWCCQATSHYLSLCWPGFMSPYGIAQPQWVKHIQSNSIPCFNFVVSTAPADSLALLGVSYPVGQSAVTVMTKFGVVCDYRGTGVLYFCMIVKTFHMTSELYILWLDDAFM